jgi:hypothetical protein
VISLLHVNPGHVKHSRHYYYLCVSNIEGYQVQVLPVYSYKLFCNACGHWTHAESCEAYFHLTTLTTLTTSFWLTVTITSLLVTTLFPILGESLQIIVKMNRLYCTALFLLVMAVAWPVTSAASGLERDLQLTTCPNPGSKIPPTRGSACSVGPATACIYDKVCW